MKKVIGIFAVVSIIAIGILVYIGINGGFETESPGSSKINQKEYETVEDITRPDIILTGDSVIMYTTDDYVDPGYKAVDDIDGDITNKVEVISDINNKTPGTYTVTYRVSDKAGNTTEVTRKVIVKVKPNTIPTYNRTTTDNEELNNYIKELNSYLSKYKVSVGYINLDNNFTYLYNENTVYFGASLIKIIDAMYVYENNITDANIIGNVKKAISVSDNTAHANLVKSIGENNLKTYSKSIGVPLTSCNYLFYCDTKVTDQLTYWLHLYDLVNTLDNGEELKNYFINDYGNFLSYDKTYTNMHKYGNSGAYFHDVGIFNPYNHYLVVILTKENGNNHGTLIGNISSKINELNEIVIKE